jgi:UDP-N-acetylglucosamine 2-epimerase (non-hydrolysing)
LKTIACIVGARPNFVKIAPILAALKTCADRLRPVLVHTGQHYDESMSDSFFNQLGLPSPDVFLETGSGTQGEQTAKVLSRYEGWLLNLTDRPSASLVVGDVNSTLACALASIKLGIPVVHVEAGLRSFDRTMPEEINRLLTDAISDLLLVSEPAGVANLRAEGRPTDSIKLVGNVMIDTLLRFLPVARERDLDMNFPPEDGYALWTMHRPRNVDDPETLMKLAASMRRIAKRLPVVFPVHPRTRSRLEKSGVWQLLVNSEQLFLTPPIGYLECLNLSCRAKVLITDSGGLQEESSVLGVPCLTLRPNTERPITVTEGTSTLVGDDVHLLEALVDEVLAGRYKKGGPMPNWDGRAAERIVTELLRFLS